MENIRSELVDSGHNFSYHTISLRDQSCLSELWENECFTSLNTYMRLNLNALVSLVLLCRVSKARVCFASCKHVYFIYEHLMMLCYGSSWYTMLFPAVKIEDWIRWMRSTCLHPPFKTFKYFLLIGTQTISTLAYPDLSAKLRETTTERIYMRKRVVLNPYSIWSLRCCYNHVLLSLISTKYSN